MSRTIKGAKGPGWEPWSNRHEKAEAKANYREADADWQEDECQGCRLCCCLKCGGHMVATDHPDTVRCLSCSHEEVERADDSKRP